MRSLKVEDVSPMVAWLQQNEKFKYLSFWPFPKRFTAITLPPFGIFIQRKWADREGISAAALRRLYRHEAVHWLQYQQYGFVGVHVRYVWHFLKGLVTYRAWQRAYWEHPHEREARALSTGGGGR